jgi:nucleoside-diphosphate-sugar epimerase
VRVLVAGGAGFIGSHMSDELVRRGHEVVVVDNLLTGRRSNIAHLEGHDGFRFVPWDVCTPPPAELAAGPRFDLVMNLASPASPSDFATIPLQILDVGSTGSKNLLELAVAHGARYFLASTSEVYGDPLVHPQPESYWGNVNPIGPRSCYDEAKRFAEAIAMAHHRVHGLEVRIARIFNTYGPRMRPDDGRVVTNFVVQALSGEPLTLYGDGEQSRSFCYVDDEVDGLLVVAESETTDPVNVGSTFEFTVRELAETVLEVTGSSSEIVCVPLPAEREGDPAQRRPQDDRIRSLGWEPTIGLRDGLARMVAAMSAELGLSGSDQPAAPPTAPAEQPRT